MIMSNQTNHIPKTSDNKIKTQKIFCLKWEIRKTRGEDEYLRKMP